MPETIRIGTRGSQLALWQANYVADLLREQYPDTQVEIVTFTTTGDKVLDKSLPSIGGKGLFTAELEAALLKGDIDCAVHSLKDLPTETPDGLTIGAIPKRAAVKDVLISKHGKNLDELPEGAKIGTSSLRRAAQLRQYRSDFEIIDIRGNVPTRINKALDPDGDYDGIILALAGVERLGLDEHITQIIPLDIMLPAPGQGAIGVQCRNNTEDIKLFSKITDEKTWLAVTAERAFLNRLEGGCSVPVAAYARDRENSSSSFELLGCVLSVDGTEKLAATAITGWDYENAVYVGQRMADGLLRKGAADILAQVKNELQNE